MSAIILDGHIAHYEALGRGRPVIFLHSWVGSWRYWIPAMQSGASMRFRTYALDFWGFGDSERLPEGYPLEQQVQLLSAFVEHMGIARVALVGHGLGAVVGMLLAQGWPTLVDRFMAVALPPTPEGVSPRLAQESPEALASWLLTVTPATEAARKEAPKADPLAIRSALDDLRRMSITDAFRSLQVPTLLVYGRRDPLVALPDEDVLSGLPEHLHAIVFEGSGHYPMLDEGSKFQRLMLDFLSLGPGETPRNLQLKEEWKRRVR